MAAPGTVIPFQIGDLNGYGISPLSSPIKSVVRTLSIEHRTTAGTDDGQPLPPLIENAVMWHVVRRADGHTI
jgi:hypothetical protein